MIHMHGDLQLSNFFCRLDLPSCFDNKSVSMDSIQHHSLEGVHPFHVKRLFIACTWIVS